MTNIASTESMTRAKRKSSISLFAITGAACVVFVSWALFIWFTSYWAFLYVPLLLIIMGIAYWLNRAKAWHLNMSSWQRRVFGILTILLIIFPPLYAYLYGYYFANKIFNSLNVDAVVVSKRATLVDRWLDLSYPRNFVIEYELNEPIEDAEDKILNRLGSQEYWRVGVTKPDSSVSYRLLGLCPYIGQNHSATAWDQTEQSSVELKKTGQLLVQVMYEAPRLCSNIK